MPPSERRHALPLLLLASVILFCAGIACSGNRQSRSFVAISQLRPGEFLREDYIKALCETLSPLAAAPTGEPPQLMVVGQDRDGISFMPVHNLHEGDNLFRPAKQGRLRLGDSEGDDFVLAVKNPESFSLRQGNSELRFRLVTDAERWVSDAVLAGRYRDQSGAEYEFKSGGQALFPGGKRFQYTLALDHVLNPYDYIYSKDLNKSWAVNISRENLSIRDIGGDHEEIVSATPRWTLSRLTPPPCR
jgi:hypothetical protein